MHKVFENEEELNARIYHFPASIIKINGNKIKYYDFMVSSKREDYISAMARIVPRIDIDEIRRFIVDVPYISELQKDFYKTYITVRYEKIIKPAWELSNKF